MDRTVAGGAAMLLAFIYEIETCRTPPNCYDLIYTHKQGRLPKPLTIMTADEVIAAQRGWSKNHGSNAAGAPQFMRATLIGLKEELRLRGGQRMGSNLGAYELRTGRQLRRNQPARHTRARAGDVDTHSRQSQTAAVHR